MSFNLKDLVLLASAAYTKSEPQFELLTKVSEDELPETIIRLARSSDIGTTFRKNLVDILLNAVKIKKSEEKPETIKAAIVELKEKGLKLIRGNAGWFSTPDYTAYEKLITSTNNYIDQLTRPALEAKTTGATAVAPVAEKKVDLNELQLQIASLQAELNSSRIREDEAKSNFLELETEYEKLFSANTELTGRLSEIKDVHTKSVQHIQALTDELVLTKQDRDQTKEELKSITHFSISDDALSHLTLCMKMEYDFEKNYNLIKNSSGSEKFIAIEKIHTALSTIFSRIIDARNMEVESKIEMPDTAIKDLITNFSPSTKTSFPLFNPLGIMGHVLSSENLFYFNAKKILENLEADKLIKINVFSMRDVHICKKLIEVQQKWIVNNNSPTLLDSRRMMYS